MKTIELFRQDVYMKEARARILRVIQNEKGCSLELDQTVFFPEGGGQPCDLGTIDDHKVTAVYEKDGIILHDVDAPADSFKEGENASLRLDWKHRFENMQRHCGEHILTGVIDREFGGVNRGFHMGEDYMTIDISMEKDPKYEILTSDMVAKAEELANELICDNVPMIKMHFDTLEEASSIPVRKPVTIENDINLVGIGNKDNAWGCVACCGTHPDYTGDVGMIKVYKVEPNKGMFRIYFDAGMKAFKKYQKEFEVLNEINSLLSASTFDLIDKYKIMVDKNNASKAHLHEISTFMSETEAAILTKKEASLSDESYGYSTVVRKDYDRLDINDLLNISKKMGEDISDVYALVSLPSLTMLMLSDGKTIDCGRFIKMNAGVYNGKGGGSPKSARALFTKKDDLEMFIKLLDIQLSN